MEYCNIIAIRDNNLDENNLICGEIRSEVERRAEKVFQDKCSQNISNWDDYTTEDIEEVLEEGYIIFGHGSIYMFWPEVIPVPYC